MVIDLYTDMLDQMQSEHFDETDDSTAGFWADEQQVGDNQQHGHVTRELWEHRGAFASGAWITPTRSQRLVSKVGLTVKATAQGQTLSAVGCFPMGLVLVVL